MAATVKCDTIVNASSATNNLALDTSGNVTVGGSLVNGSSFLRNKIINGGMNLDQRNEGASQTITAAAALAYTVDRWYAYCTGANVTGQRVSNTGTAASPSQNAYQFTGAASVTAIGFGQRIEAVNCYDLANTTATLSVSLANSVLTTVTWTAYYANTTDTFGTLASPTVTQIATGTFTVNSTLTRYTANISVPAAATTGIQILLTVGAQTSGTWTIGNVQLEAGAAATPFERTSFTQQLALSQRYFQKTYSIGTALASATKNGLQGGAYQEWFTIFKIDMRAAPTITYWDGAGNASKYSSLTNQVWTDNLSTGAATAFQIGTTGAIWGATGSTGTSYQFVHFTASAEL